MEVCFFADGAVLVMDALNGCAKCLCEKRVGVSKYVSASFIIFA